jgi:DNA-binding NarL/FixJ family response regulator
LVSGRRPLAGSTAAASDPRQADPRPQSSENLFLESPEAAIRRAEIAAIIVDPDDRIAMANASGIEHLRFFAPQGLIQRDHPLPEAVVRLVNGMRDDLRREAPKNSSVITLPNGVCMRGSMLEGEPEALLVLFEPASRLKERNLSPRELEVTTLVLNGLSNREIAAKLTVAHHTVEGHLKRIFSKMQVRTRSGLVAKMLGWQGDTDSENGR